MTQNRYAVLIATVKADVSLERPLDKIVMQPFGMYKESTYENGMEKDTKYFIAANVYRIVFADSPISKTYINEKEAKRLIWRTDKELYKEHLEKTV